MYNMHLSCFSGYDQRKLGMGIFQFYFLIYVSFRSSLLHSRFYCQSPLSQGGSGETDTNKIMAPKEINADPDTS